MEKFIFTQMEVIKEVYVEKSIVAEDMKKSLKIMEKTVKVLKNCRTIKNKIESLVLLYFIKKYKKVFEKINF
ncbi:hypothetical protein KWX64_12860 [Clostridioides difficile]|nr:hypothetical protein [Clostridioides difficile]